MANATISKILLIVSYIVIIIMIPLLLSLLMKVTVDANRITSIKELAQTKSIETKKPLIAFDSINHGAVVNLEKNKSIEEFDGSITEIINQMADNSCVLIVSNVLEFVDDDRISDLVNQITRVSGGDLYTINIGKYSPRLLWDYKIKRIMNKQFYLPKDKINWSKPNKLEVSIQKFYSSIFKILPYDFMTKNVLYGINAKN